MFVQGARLGAYPQTGCVGFVHVAGTYTRLSDGSYRLQADTPDASSAGQNTGYGQGEIFTLPDGFGTFSPPGTTGRVVLNGTLFEGNRIYNVQGWGLNEVMPAPPAVTPGQSCPAGTATAPAPAAPAPAPAPASGGGTAAPAPTTTTAAPAPTTTTTAAPAPTTTTAAPAPAATVPTYGPADTEGRREELEGEYASPATTEGPTVAPLNVGLIAAGAAIFAVLLTREPRR